MSNKLILNFAFQYKSDGTTPGVVQIDLTTGPVAFSSPGGNTEPLLSPTFSSLPSGTVNLSSSSGGAVTQVSLTAGVLKVSDAGPLTAGQIYTISGQLEF